MPDRFVPSGRTVHPLSTRCCVGEHPSGRGRRVDGYMLVRIRHEYHAQAFVRELDVNEAFTMRELYDIISRECHNSFSEFVGAEITFCYSPGGHGGGFSAPKGLRDRSSGWRRNGDNSRAGRRARHRLLGRRGGYHGQGTRSAGLNDITCFDKNCETSGLR